MLLTSVERSSTPHQPRLGSGLNESTEDVLWFRAALRSLSGDTAQSLQAKTRLRSKYGLFVVRGQ
jgi:hypothetical protein